MNKKGQLDFGDMEFSPGSAVIGVIGAGATLIIMSNAAHVGLFWKILGLIFGGVIGYFIGNKMLG